MEVAAVSMPEGGSAARPHVRHLAALAHNDDPLAGVIDPDVDLIDPDFEAGGDDSVRPSWRRQAPAVLATALGGVLGAEARYGVSVAVPHAVNAFAWSTVAINVSGCLALGALMVVLLELRTPHHLARPFLGVGVLGGYTTYSTFAVDVQRLLVAHRPLVALAYLVATVVSCAVAVWLSTTVTLWVSRRVFAVEGGR
jgi:CrcB protein